MTLWFTSDHHFGHRNIIDFSGRPWADVEAMNAGLLERHNKLVAPDDVVYILGDLVWQESELETVSYMNGRKFLVPGNHDRVHKMHKSWAKHVAAYEAAGLTITPSIVDMTIGSTPVQLCHFPYKADEFDEYDRARGREDKFSGLRPDDVGGWLIHGHVHTMWQVNGRQINVGVDAGWDWRPVSEEQLVDIIDAFS